MIHPPARKSLGQHFLHQRSVIEAIVRSIDPKPGDVVVEIGPGRGALTEAVAPRVAALHGVELDRLLAERLAGRKEQLPNFILHREDALHFDFCSPGSPVRVIGNLPYNISTPLLFRLLDHLHCIVDLHLMLQKEVVDRMLAPPGSRTYGRLSVMVQQRCRGELVLQVAPGAFTPPPGVQSAVVSLVPQAPPGFVVDDPRRFARLVKKAFAQRRKTLRNALKGMVTENEMLACGIAPEARPEQLSVAQFVQLSNFATSK